MSRQVSCSEEECNQQEASRSVEHNGGRRRAGSSGVTRVMTAAPGKSLLILGLKPTRTLNLWNEARLYASHSSDSLDLRPSLKPRSISKPGLNPDSFVPVMRWAEEKQTKENSIS